MRRFRQRGDSGVIAVVMAVVLVGLLIPLTAYGVSTYVKSGLGGELQRAADAGATAGASRIPLVDAGVVQNILNGAVPGLPITTPLTPPDLTKDLVAYAGLKGYCTVGDAANGSATSGNCPLDIAVQTCEAAIAQSLANGYGKSYATDPAGTVHCTAKYGDNPTVQALLDCLKGAPASLLGSLGTPLPDSAVSQLLGSLSGLLGGLTSTLLQNNVVKTVPAGLLGALLPSILTPRVTVTAHWNERGPLDALTNPSGNGQAQAMTRDGTARRAFRNLIVVPTVTAGPQVATSLLQSIGNLLQLGCGLLGLLPCPPPTVYKPPVLPPGSTIDLNPALGTYLAQLQTLAGDVNSTLFTQLGSLLPAACSTILPSLQTDLSDILSPPPTGAPSLSTVETSALANAEPVLVLQVPAGITSPLLIPFLSFVPTCLSKLPDGSIKGIVQNLDNPSGPLGDVGSCTLAAPGLFRGRLVA